MCTCACGDGGGAIHKAGDKPSGRGEGFERGYGRGFVHVVVFRVAVA